LAVFNFLYCRELTEGTISPFTRGAWRDAFHSAGINLRYLARVRSLIPKSCETLRQVLLVEMSVRVAKNMLWSALRQRVVVDGQDDAQVCRLIVAEFLNRMILSLSSLSLSLSLSRYHAPRSINNNGFFGVLNRCIGWRWSYATCLACDVASSITSKVWQ
jgi:hypothetical protein